VAPGGGAGVAVGGSPALSMTAHATPIASANATGILECGSNGAALGRAAVTGPASRTVARSRHWVTFSDGGSGSGRDSSSRRRSEPPPFDPSPRGSRRASSEALSPRPRACAERRTLTVTRELPVTFRDDSAPTGGDVGTDATPERTAVKAARPPTPADRSTIPGAHPCTHCPQCVGSVR
jgi:hypothetical protein